MNTQVTPSPETAPVTKFCRRQLTLIVILVLAASASAAASGTVGASSSAGTASDNSCADCRADTDSDGVVDRTDRCPHTPTGAPVSSMGCTHDSDKDGVVDYEDRCASTPANAKIDVQGCPLSAEIALPRVDFASGSATLNNRASRSLKPLISTLILYPELRIEIAGFTDNRGDPERNRQLSKRRADAVRNYLLANGVSAGRVRSRGYGEAQPVGDNDSPWGRALNRRVVVRVLNFENFVANQ